MYVSSACHCQCLGPYNFEQAYNCQTSLNAIKQSSNKENYLCLLDSKQGLYNVEKRYVHCVAGSLNYFEYN